jgi:hypothetical protein
MSDSVAAPPREQREANRPNKKEAAIQENVKTRIKAVEEVEDDRKRETCDR